MKDLLDSQEDVVQTSFHGSRKAQLSSVELSRTQPTGRWKRFRLTITRFGGIVVVYLLILFTIRVGLLWSLSHMSDLMDFGSFVATGRAAAGGLDPYGVYPLTYHFSAYGVEFDAVNRNPPITAVLFQAFAPWDTQTARRVWYAISLGIFAFSVALVCRAHQRYAVPLRVAWAMSLAGLWQMLILGQIYAPLVLASTAAWILLENRHFTSAGVLIGVLVAIKPNFLVWPVLLLMASYWTTSFVALTVSFFLSVVPVILFGPIIYSQWVHSIATQIALDSPTNGSLIGLMSRLGLPEVGIALSALFLLALAAWAWRRRPPVMLVSGFALIASLLASPEAWTGYTLFLLPLFFAYRQSWWFKISGLLLIVPDSVVLTLAGMSSIHYLAVAYLANLALLLVLGGVVKEARIANRKPIFVHDPIITVSAAN